MNTWDAPGVKKLVALALEEDLGTGDITSELSVPPELRGSAKIIAREPLVVCGLGAIEACLAAFGKDFKVNLESSEGAGAKDGVCLARIEAPVRSLLSTERTILNFLQRLSGIATMTRRVVESAGGLSVFDTRKTTPGWRVLEKYAVRVGGGENHRGDLSELILIKNNHIDANGGDIRATIEAVHKGNRSKVPIEVEVRSFEELEAALEVGCDIIMLDNMDDEQIKKAMEFLPKSGKRPMIEVSGGVLPERFKRLKALGVDRVSLGALTMKAVAVDISMRIETTR